MKKLFFALSLVGILMSQSLTYANPIVKPIIQETEQEEEAAVVGETAAAEASFTQELKKRFIEGGPGFMGIVLVCGEHCGLNTCTEF